MTGLDDTLLDVLEQFINAVRAVRDRLGLSAEEALIEAIDDWVVDHAISHPGPLTLVDHDREPLDAGLRSLLAAVRRRRGDRSDLTVVTVLTEALDGWVAATVAEHHRSMPYRRA
jgi:hypothetical protein